MPLARPGLRQFIREILEIERLELDEIRRGDAVRRGRLRDDPGVGAAVERDAVKGVPHAVEIFERARHRAAACAPGEHKRAVDVEQQDGLQGATLTAIEEQSPFTVLCRSSPSCSASLCLPGVSCMSIFESPLPKWIHDGVPLTMVCPAFRHPVSTPTWKWPTP